MTYCTVDSLIANGWHDELIQLTDSSGVGIINTAVVNKKIAEATAIINRYLNQYTLPLAVVPEDFEGLACDICRFSLQKEPILDDIRFKYQEAIRYLEKVSSGAIRLPPDVNGNSPTATGSTLLLQSDDPSHQWGNY